MNTKAAIPQELEKNHWLSKGQSYLKEHLERSEIKKVAKNVIFFIGDGMSLATVAAARTLEGQMRGETGEENKLAFEKFPAIGLSHVSIFLNKY